MLQIYNDGDLVYDSRHPQYKLLGLETTEGLNKSGTATITMPPDHPAYNSFVSYRTVVEIYEDRELRFRGRPLYPTDDLLRRRTITCEGERGFLRDAILRPYLYQDDPKNIFTAVMEFYNSKVEPFKQFVIGEITVTDPNDYIRLESEEAKNVGVVVDELVERCGGVITFTTNEAGRRVINWYEQLDTQSGQEIELGQNLLDFQRTTANSDLATVLVPYGAKNETTGERVSIADVNGGLDYIQDDAAVALRGVIEQVVTWDDVTTPEALLAKAKQKLNEMRNLIASLEVTAVDLSKQNKNVDSFRLGDLIRVKSKPHGEKGDLYQLTDRTRDLLHPANDKIALGKNIASLTGADVVASAKTSNDVQKVEREIRAAYKVNIGEHIEASERKMTSIIEQTSEELLFEVSRTYVTGSQVDNKISSSITQLADSITLEVSGSLGGTARIAVSVDGTITDADLLDLSAVREAFANDASAVTIEAGTITFNSGTLIINSDNLQVNATGKITATDAVIYGDIITIDGSFMTELDRGSLRLYYDDALCGTINTKYWSGASTEGISLRIEEAGSYIMFSHPSDAGTGYDVDYYLNYGWSSTYTEKHIFQTSARFLDDVYLQRSYHRALYLVNGDGTYLVAVNSSGALTVSKV